MTCAYKFKGTLDLGDFTVGDYLYLSGDVMAYVKTTHYYAGLVTAAMVTSFDYALTLNELPPAPIPEPMTVLLIGVGLIGLGACRRLVR